MYAWMARCDVMLFCTVLYASNEEEEEEGEEEENMMKKLKVEYVRRI